MLGCWAMEGDLYLAAKQDCPLCQSNDLRLFADISRFDPPFQLSQCQKCGHIFINPGWQSRVLQRMYSQQYYAGLANYHYHDERESVEFDRIVWHARMKKIKSYVASGNLCDVGCSFGGLLSEAQPDFRCFGVEPSRYAYHYLQNRCNFDLFCGELVNVPWPEASMDVITAIEVVEHIPDPQPFFRKLGKMLKPGGLAVIQTADFDGWQAVKQGSHYHYFLPGHCHCYTASNLKWALRHWSGIKRIVEFRGVEFGLWPKLAKSRGNFNHWTDYRHWFRISAYHYLSKLRWRGRYMTSAMVLYAFK